jgi:hypothetical protein
LIHVAIICHHLEYLDVTGGFAVMAAARWWFAVGVLRRPSSRLRALGIVLLLRPCSRGCCRAPAVWHSPPGAEDRAARVLADVVANVFCVVAIAGLASTWWREAQGGHLLLPSGIAHAVAWVVAIGGVLVTVPAVLMSHHHADPDHPAGDTPMSHDHPEPSDGGHHDGPHDHADPRERRTRWVAGGRSRFVVVQGFVKPDLF